MKQYLKLLLIFCSILLSCKKDQWYNAKPDSTLLVPSTLKDFQALMDNAEILTQQTPSLGECGSDGHYVADATFNIMTPGARNAYTWSHQQPYTGLMEWNGLSGTRGAFPKIFYCNLIIEGLNNMSVKDRSDNLVWNDIMGQALFYRAKSFFEIAEVFAPPYNSGTASSDLGVPLRLSSDPLIRSERANIKQTYDQIISDLLSAKSMLSQGEKPTSALLKCRPRLAAVFAMLARVYLSMEDYANAEKYADSTLSNYNTLLEYKSVNTATLQRFNVEVILHSTMSTEFHPARPANLLIDTSLYNSFDVSDRRKTLFFNRNATTKLVTYRGGYAGSNTVFTGLAVDEVYLIKAECAARAGNKDIAMTYLNTLLQNRWISGVTYIPQVAIDADDALKRVLLERKKELILRGLRWSDLRRLNKDDRFKIVLSRTTPIGTFSIEPNTYKYTYPIPDDIISISGMKQNVGW